MHARCAQGASSSYYLESRPMFLSPVSELDHSRLQHSSPLFDDSAVKRRKKIMRARGYFSRVYFQRQQMCPEKNRLNLNVRGLPPTIPTPKTKQKISPHLKKNGFNVRGIAPPNPSPKTKQNLIAPKEKSLECPWTPTSQHHSRNKTKSHRTSRRMACASLDSHLPTPLPKQNKILPHLKKNGLSVRELPPPNPSPQTK
ncbi:hypothetical protein BaRGS_00021219 [Batillaria attramentaria]|uniref:Uncharacterized protein n=1 Tax=Batillaria attramentaria TaxID=370345 RepID=A0ABD0KKA8_9CAEN